jgi:nucleotide-binding universal stress UspA family protein
MTNFIVPVDFSVDSLKGLDWALLFSRKTSVNIQLVYVLTNSTNFQPSVVEQEHKYAQTHFEKLIKESEPKLGKKSRIGYIIKKGKVYREVVNQVNSYQQAVVSASTHGASGFEELFIGSNALKIIAATERPVFTIRKPIPDKITRIVLPIKLHLVCVSTSSNKKDLGRLESYAKQMIGYFKARELKCVTKTLVGDSLPILTSNYAEAVDAELCIIMSSAVDKWNVFLGSFSQQMINKSSIPLLNITPQEKHITSGFRTFGG